MKNRKFGFVCLAAACLLVVPALTAFSKGGEAVMIISYDTENVVSTVPRAFGAAVSEDMSDTDAAFSVSDSDPAGDYADAEVFLVLEGTASGYTGTLSAYVLEDGLWNLKLRSPARYGSAGLYKEAEGDNRTPVGIFRMNTPFGTKEALAGFPEEYIRVDESLYWNGDSSSELYNKLVDTDDFRDFDLSLSEHLIDYDGYYDYAIDTGYNPSGIPMKGSAIFLHCLHGAENTHGCIAVSEEDMTEIMRLYRDAHTYIAIYDSGASS